MRIGKTVQMDDAEGVLRKPDCSACAGYQQLLTAMQHLENSSM
jgi:hypothetical protein